MKKKLLLMGVCICILILIFARNIYVQINQDKEVNKPNNQENIQITTNKMTIQEAYRLAGYLGISNGKLEEAFGLSEENSESDNSKSEETATLEGNLKYGQSMELLVNVCEEYNIEKSEVLNKLSFDLAGKSENSVILTEEFLDLYETILAVIPKDKKPVTEKTLFVLGNPDDTTEGKSDSLVTDGGTYSFGGAISYDGYYSNGVLNLTTDKENDTATEDENIIDNTQTKDSDVQEDNSKNFGKVFQAKDYTFSKIVVMASGEHIIYIKGRLE